MKSVTSPLFLLVALLVAALPACRGEVERTAPARSEATAEPAPPPSPARTATATAEAAADRPLVAFLGDSLTAGLGLEEYEAYPAVVADRLAEMGEPIRVINAGVSGDTSAGGLRRLSWLLKQKPAVLVVGLGANDGLRGLPVEDTERNLREIVRRGKEAGVRVLLLGMKIPTNYGDYAAQFSALYPRVARELGVPLVPFLLEDVGGDPDLNQADGIHPNAEGQQKVAGNVLPYLRPLVEAAEAG
jgi:acyl-CoA thioesterase I